MNVCGRAGMPASRLACPPKGAGMPGPHGVPPGLPAAGMLVCPESPAWLALKGQRREAVAVAEKLWGPDGASQLGSGAAVGARRRGVPEPHNSTPVATGSHARRAVRCHVQGSLSRIGEKEREFRD